MRPRGEVAAGGDHREFELPRLASILAVCAHPDDESFGLGAVLSAFADAGTHLGVLCFTHGEASTLHAAAGELATVRAHDLSAAAAALGVERTELLAYPGGRLANQPLGKLADHVRRLARRVEADALLVFDEGGVTGHPDHRQATAAALTAANEDLRVLAWTLPRAVAQALNDEFGTAFVGRRREEVDIVLQVDRYRQREAIRGHRSQSIDDPVLWWRLHFQGEAEWLRWLRVGESAMATTARGPLPA